MNLTARRVGYLLTRADWDGCLVCAQSHREYVIHTRAGVMSARLCEQHAGQLVLDREVVELVKLAQ